MSATRDKVEGKVKEIGGRVSGDRRTEAEGKGQNLAGKAKGKVVDVKKKAEGAAEKITGR